MRRIISAVSRISIASGANIFAGIVRTKIFAIILGTVGVGVISQLTNFSNLALFVSTVGIPIGITKFVSELEKDGKWAEINEILSKGLFILISIGVLFFAVTLIFSKKISFLILDSDSYSFLLIIMAVSFPFTVVIIVFEAFLRGLKKFNQYVKISVINSVLGLVITVTLVYFFRITGFAFSVLVNGVISILVYLYFFHRSKILQLKNLKLFDFKISDPLKAILKLGVASLVLGALDQFTLIAIRSLIIKDMGIETNGIYQCVYGISNNYFMIFYMSISIYILPVLSEIKETGRMNDEINNAYRLTLLIIVPITTLTFVAREYIILILYTSKFMPAGNLMLYNFIGDFFKALSWVLGAWLIPNSKFRLWLVLGILYYVNYFLIFFVLNYFKFDIKSVVIAYAIAGFLHFVINLYYIKKLHAFHFRIDSFKLMITSSLFFGFILAVSSYKIEIGYFCILPLLLIWLKMSVKKEEVHKLLKLIRLRQ